MRPMFTVEERSDVRAALIDLARSDARVIAAAEVGSMTTDGADRWSDLDLTFGLAAGVEAIELLDDWADELKGRWGAVRLFDLRSVDTLYRVFLFPGYLQVDLSATPGGVSRMGPKFRVLFGDAVRHDAAPPPEPLELYGLCVHHAVRIRVSIERSRLWAAEYYVSELRHEALSLAAVLRGLPARYARSFHELPPPLMELASDSLVRHVDAIELERAFAAGIELLMAAAAGLQDAAVPAADLRSLLR